MSDSSEPRSPLAAVIALLSIVTFVVLFGASLALSSDLGRTLGQVGLGILAIGSALGLVLALVARGTTAGLVLSLAGLALTAFLVFYFGSFEGGTVVDGDGPDISAPTDGGEAPGEAPGDAPSDDAPAPEAEAEGDAPAADENETAPSPN